MALPWNFVDSQCQLVTMMPVVHCLHLVDLTCFGEKERRALELGFSTSAKKNYCHLPAIVCVLYCRFKLQVKSYNFYFLTHSCPIFNTITLWQFPHWVLLSVMPAEPTHFRCPFSPLAPVVWYLLSAPLYSDFLWCW